jgi:UDP-N-acetylmuramyl pentapeptide phosphotransferase/UDP-N-acetylglucosamine-1-phosphate transferase
LGAVVQLQVGNEIGDFAVLAVLAVSVGCCCQFASRLGTALGVVDHPDGGRKAHATPTPLIGGLALMFPVVLCAAWEALGAGAQPVFGALAVAGGGAALLGYLDDRHNLAAPKRLLASFGLAAVAIALEPRMLLEELDLGFGWTLPLGVWALPFTLLCVVGLQNAVNMADGKNGLVLCLGVIWLCFLLYYAPSYLHLYLTVMLAGFMILLLYNLKGKVFLGDAGSYSIGMVLALLGVYIYNVANSQLPMLTVALWFLVPVLDCLRVIGQRLRAGRSPFSADCNHLHHRLANTCSWSRGLAVYVGVVAMPGVAALLSPEMTLPLIGLTVAAYSWIVYWTRSETMGLAPRRFDLHPGLPKFGCTVASRLVYICDWLPPDFGAIGQYSLSFARDYALGGREVVLVGLASQGPSRTVEVHGSGRLTILRVAASSYDKGRWRQRLRWTVRANLRLLRTAAPAVRQADELIFTGAPPFLLHFAWLANLLWRKRLIYRITDFYPECLMAALPRVPRPLHVFYRFTCFLRRQVDQFQVLGLDQIRRLEAIGIPSERMVLKRDMSPVRITGLETPLPVPEAIRGHVILLYSGNWGIAHEVETFVQGYIRHHLLGSGRVALWLNAAGTGTGAVEQRLKGADVPIVRTGPVPLQDLARLLVAPDAHLITLKDEFVGYVMPSKVYGCIESGRPILFVGNRQSDVDLLCCQAERVPWYRRVSVGDPAGVAAALEELANQSVIRVPLAVSNLSVQKSA